MKQALENKIASFKQQISTLVRYMESKANARDWHAVSDAANDVRELETGVQLCEELLREIENHDSVANRQAASDSSVPAGKSVHSVEKRARSALRGGSEENRGGEEGRK